MMYHPKAHFWAGSREALRAEKLCATEKKSNSAENPNTESRARSYLSLNKKYFWFYVAVLSPWTLGVVLSLVWFCASVSLWGAPTAPGWPRGASGAERRGSAIAKKAWPRVFCHGSF